MEKKTQLYFYDNNKFEFRKLQLISSCLSDKTLEQEKGAAWRHSYSGQYDFPGYKNISADTVTLGFARDIFLDPHGKVPETKDTTGKPSKDGVKAWIAQVATNQRQVYRSKIKRHTTADIINFGLITVIGFMIIGWIIRFASGG